MKKLFPDEIVIHTQNFNIGQDWEVPIPGFFVIAPNRKIRSLADFSEAEAQEFIFLARKLRQGMRDILGINDVYLFQNEDTEHDFHLWAFPRYQWMERFGRKIESVRPIMNFAIANMTTKPVIKEVKYAVLKLGEYML